MCDNCCKCKCHEVEKAQKELQDINLMQFDPDRPNYWEHYASVFNREAELEAIIRGYDIGGYNE